MRLFLILIILFSTHALAFRSGIGFWRNQCPIYSYGPNYNIAGSIDDVATDGFNTYIAGSIQTRGGVRSGIAAYDPSGNLLPFNPRVNGYIYDIELINNKLYVAGAFSEVNGTIIYSQSVELDNSNSLNQSFPQTNSASNVVIPDGAGGWIIAGPFTAVGGYKRTGLARINSDGSIHALSMSITGTVYGLTLSGSTLYLVGSFTSINGTARNRIAAVNVDTGVLSSFNPNANSTVYSLVVSGTNVFVAGAFTNVGGQARTRLASLDASTGLATTALSLTANGTVMGLSISGTTLYASGVFTQISGTGRNRLASINIGVSPATLGTWNPNVDSTVNVLYQNGSTLYIGGTFTSVGGNSRTSVAAYDITTPASPTLLALNPNINSSVTALAVRGSYLYVGGSFTTSGGLPRKNFSEVSLADGSTTSFVLNSYFNNGIKALSAQGTRLFISGNVTSYGSGIARNNFAVFDVTSNTNNVTSFDPSLDGRVLSMVARNNTLYLGGDFTVAGGNSREGIAAIDTSSNSITSFNPGAPGTVMKLLLDGTNLYVSGIFTTLGGASRENLGVVDITLDTNNATSFNPTFNEYIYNMAIKGSNLYVSGEFSTIGGATRDGIAALNKSTGAVQSFNPTHDGFGIYGMGMVGSSLYISGDFTTVNGVFRDGIAALNVNLDTNNTTNFYPAISNSVGNLVIKDNTIYFSGYDYLEFSDTTLRTGLAAFGVCDP